MNPQEKLFLEYDKLYRSGRRLYEEARYDEAAKTLLKLVDAGLKEADIYKLCAISLGGISKDKEKDALAVVYKGLVQNPKDLDLLYLKHKYTFNVGEVSKALDGLRDDIKNYPGELKFSLLFATFCADSNNPNYLMEGVKAAQKVLEDDPENVTALTCVGTILSGANKPKEAAEYLIKAVRIKPDNMVALINLASCFHKMAEPQMALNFYENVLRLSPDYGLALCGKGTILCNHGLSQEYAHLLKQGADLMLKAGRISDYINYFSNYILYIHYIPYFDRREIYESIKSMYHLICGNMEEKPRISFGNTADPARKLRVGVISSCFRKHPVTWMTLAAMDNLDKDQFELYCYSDVDFTKKDDVTTRYFGFCAKVYELQGKSNKEVVELMRNDDLDILLELTGHSEGGRRMPVAAARVAPVQVKWVGGLFNTTGVPQVDWILGDKIEIPEGDDQWYTERVYRMPDDYVVYEPRLDLSEVKPLPALKNGYVTFANMNNITKTNTFTIALWSKILKAVPNSRLLMKTKYMDTPFAKKHIEDQFARYGVGIDRLILEPGEGHKAFMESYNRVDIALDPHPYTGGLSTCESLWMGVPVITLPGETFAGRHGATHLYNAGLPDWIAHSEDDYVALAVKWANDLDGLAKLRAGLREQVKNSPLCDGPRFARNFEDALRFMWKDWCDEKRKHDAPKAIKPPKPKKKKKK